MREVEVRQLFLIILNTYSAFAYDDDKVAIWADILQDVTFEMAQINLRKYIRDPKNNFPPHPGILAETPTQIAVGPYIPNAEETRLMLDKMDQHRLSSTTEIPDHIRERMKSLGSLRQPGVRTDESIPTTSES